MSRHQRPNMHGLRNDKMLTEWPSHFDLGDATEDISKSLDESTPVRVTKLIQLLRIVQNKKTPDHWKEPNHVSTKLLKLIRLFLVDRDKNIRVQGVRACRYLLWNANVLKLMISLNIPILICRCLEREDHRNKQKNNGKGDKYYVWERTQSLKFIRHIIEYYPLLVPRCICMSLIAIAQTHKEGEMRDLCLEFIRELLFRNPSLVASCNGIKLIIESILDHSLSHISNSLILTVLYILDHPETRKYLRPNMDINKLISSFNEPSPVKKDEKLEEAQRKKEDVSHNTLLTILKSITGILYLGSDEEIIISSESDDEKKDNKETKLKKANVLQSLIRIMKLPNEIKNMKWSRKLLFDILDEILLPLSDNKKLDDTRGPNLVVNYIALILCAFINNGLLETLIEVGLRHDVELAPKARNLLSRIQLLGARYLPKSLCHKICNLPKVVHSATQFNKRMDITVSRNFATNMVIELSEPGIDENINNEIDDINNSSDLNNNNNNLIQVEHICHRIGPSMDLNSTFIRYRYMMDRYIPALMFQNRIPYHNHQESLISDESFQLFSLRSQRSSILDFLKDDHNSLYTDINNMLSKSQVTNTKDFMLWNMDQVWKIINGPLWHEKYLSNILNNSRNRFIKRLLRYLKPTRTHFSQLKWTPNTFRHAQCSVQLFRLLSSCDIGINYSYFQELIIEIFDNLKDQMNCNLLKKRPKISHAPFSRQNITNTLSRVYLVLIGILSESKRGLNLIHKHLFSFLLTVPRREETELKLPRERLSGPNDYLLRLLAVNLDYTRDKSLRILFPTWGARGSFHLRKSLISHLELLYRAHMPNFDEWSIEVVSLMLKQSNKRLALTALKALEKINLIQNSISQRNYLIKFIRTKIKPDNTNIGNYGQFLFIKTLSTNEGFKFLRYETNWLDKTRLEWKSNFNKEYTKMLETALFMAVNNKSSSNNKINYENANENSNSQENTWIPYHLVHEHKTDEEELYHEYLIHFPWKMSIKVIYNTGQEITLPNDTFFDYNAFLPPKDNKKLNNNNNNKNNEKYPISLGTGVHCIILDKSGMPRPFHIDKSAKIKIKLEIGYECMVDAYRSKIREKIVQLNELKRRNNNCSIINDGPNDQIYFILEPGPIDNNTGKRDMKHSYLSRIFFSISQSQKSSSLVRPLPHLYGELAKTINGCKYIKEKKDLEYFINIINKFNNNNINEYVNDTLELRSSLWTIGMIGSSPTGLQLLKTTNIIKIISNMCYNSHTLSIRGTCLYILGLISRTKEGMNLLSSYQFDFPSENYELDLAVAIPKNISKFFNLTNTNYVKSFAKDLTNSKVSVYSPPSLARPFNMKPLDPNELLGQSGYTEQTVLAHLSALCSHVTQKSSANVLHKLHSKKPSVFGNPLLFRESLKLINCYNYKLNAKRFILFNLFDNVILDKTTLELFNHNLNSKILDHQKIRQWRYNYKLKQRELKLKNKKLNKEKNNKVVISNNNSKDKKDKKKDNKNNNENNKLIQEKPIVNSNNSNNSIESKEDNTINDENTEDDNELDNEEDELQLPIETTSLINQNSSNTSNNSKENNKINNLKRVSFKNNNLNYSGNKMPIMTLPNINHNTTNTTDKMDDIFNNLKKLKLNNGISNNRSNTIRNIPSTLPVFNKTIVKNDWELTDSPTKAILGANPLAEVDNEDS